MANTTKLLLIAIGVLMVDSIIELSFVSSMVGWLHRRAGGAFEIAYNGGTYSLHGKPLHLLVDQGHTTNGADGTAFIAIGIGGLVILWMRSKPNLWRKGYVKGLYHFWLVMTFLGWLLTFVALIYTFVVTTDHNGQTIDQNVASKLNNQPYPNQVPYPLQKWTPQNWFAAVLQLDLVHSNDRSSIETAYHVMRGWQYNLILMFIIGLVVTVLAFWDAFERRKQMRDVRVSEPKDRIVHE